MERPLPTRCLVCSGPVQVERVRCQACACALEGQFGLDWVGALSGDQLQFVKVFLNCRGKIKDVEQALGLSYPTVVSRLDAVVEAIGGARGVAGTAEARAPAVAPSTPQRLEVLEQLANGTLDIDAAEALLRRGR
jgi:hypothetical protein